MITTCRLKISNANSILLLTSLYVPNNTTNAILSAGLRSSSTPHYGIISDDYVSSSSAGSARVSVIVRIHSATSLLATGLAIAALLKSTTA